MTRIDLELLPDPVVVVGPEHELEGWNRAATELLGPLERLVGHVGVGLDLRALDGTAVFRDDWPPASRTVWWTALHRIENRRVTVAVTAALRGTESSPEGAVLVVRPAPEVDPLEAIAAVSHELRSPLTSMKGFTAVLAQRWDRLGVDQRTEMIEAIAHDAERVTRLITELLDIGRLGSGRLELRPEPVDLARLAATVVDRLASTYPDLDCSLEFDEPFPAVVADPHKVEQVLTNLVENAAKYATPKGIRIVGTIDEDEVQVEVIDRGRGIDPDDLPRVFTKFFRSDRAKPSGTGLGLWISRGLAEAHGGRLEAAAGPGGGAGFKLSLPRSPTESTGPSDRA